MFVLLGNFPEPIRDGYRERHSWSAALLPPSLKLWKDKCEAVGVGTHFERGQLEMEERMHNPISRRMILRLLGGCAALALVSTRALSDPLDEGGFRQTVIALLSRRHPEWHVEPGADPRTIKIGSADIYLDNIYRYARDLPSAEQNDKIVALIENGVARSEASPEKPEFGAASNRIRPQIVPPDYLQQAGDLVHRGFLAGLIVAHAIDEKERYELIRQPDMIPGTSGRLRSTHARSPTLRQFAPGFR